MRNPNTPDSHVRNPFAQRVASLLAAGSLYITGCDKGNNQPQLEVAAIEETVETKTSVVTKKEIKEVKEEEKAGSSEGTGELEGGEENTTSDASTSESQPLPTVEAQTLTAEEIIAAVDTPGTGEGTVTIVAEATTPAVDPNLVAVVVAPEAATSTSTTEVKTTTTTVETKAKTAETPKPFTYGLPVRPDADPTKPASIHGDLTKAPLRDKEGQIILACPEGHKGITVRGIENARCEIPAVLNAETTKTEEGKTGEAPKTEETAAKTVETKAEEKVEVKTEVKVEEAK